jgi:hypothetical protein
MRELYLLNTLIFILQLVVVYVFVLPNYEISFNGDEATLPILFFALLGIRILFFFIRRLFSKNISIKTLMMSLWTCLITFINGMLALELSSIVENYQQFTQGVFVDEIVQNVFTAKRIWQTEEKYTIFHTYCKEYNKNISIEKFDEAISNLADSASIKNFVEQYEITALEQFKTDIWELLVFVANNAYNVCTLINMCVATYRICIFGILIMNKVRLGFNGVQEVALEALID